MNSGVIGSSASTRSSSPATTSPPASASTVAGAAGTFFGPPACPPFSGEAAKSEMIETVAAADMRSREMRRDASMWFLRGTYSAGSPSFYPHHGPHRVRCARRQRHRVLRDVRGLHAQHVRPLVVAEV